MSDRKEAEFFDPKIKKYVDLFQLCLLDAAAETLIPELYDVLGREKMLEFLDKFGGMTLQVPSKEVISASARAVSIYVAFVGGEPVSQIAKRFETSKPTVEKVVDRIGKLIRGVSEE